MNPAPPVTSTRTTVRVGHLSCSPRATQAAALRSPLPCSLVPDRIRVLRVIARMNVGGPARIVADLMDDLDPDRFEQRLLTGRVADDEADELELRPPRSPTPASTGSVARRTPSPTPKPSQG